MPGATPASPKRSVSRSPRLRSGRPRPRPDRASTVNTQTRYQNGTVCRTLPLAALAVATETRPSDVILMRWQRRPARTRHRAICDDDDRYRANLVRTAPLLRADMILGKDECG